MGLKTRASAQSKSFRKLLSFRYKCCILLHSHTQAYGHYLTNKLLVLACTCRILFLPKYMQNALFNLYLLAHRRLSCSAPLTSQMRVHLLLLYRQNFSALLNTAIHMHYMPKISYFSHTMALLQSITGGNSATLPVSDFPRNL